MWNNRVGIVVEDVGPLCVVEDVRRELQCNRRFVISMIVFVSRKCMKYNEVFVHKASMSWSLNNFLPTETALFSLLDSHKHLTSVRWVYM